MIQEEAAPSSKSTSETHINTRSRLSISLPLKEPTADNTFSAEERPLSPQETCSQLTKFQKVPPSAISSHQLETKDPTLDAQEPMPQLWDTLKMDQKQESDCLQAPEKPFLEAAEPQSVLLLEEEETRNQL